MPAVSQPPFCSGRQGESDDADEADEVPALLELTFQPLPESALDESSGLIPKLLQSTDADCFLVCLLARRRVPSTRAGRPSVLLTDIPRSAWQVTVRARRQACLRNDCNVSLANKISDLKILGLKCKKKNKAQKCHFLGKTLNL